MTIYVFSDSHGSNREMIALIEAAPPDACIHLGDGAKDAHDVQSIFPHIPFYQVAGNCDMFSQLPSISQLELEGVRLLFSHGHLWSVKSRTDIAVAAGKDANADIILFGHTHIPLCTQEKNMWVINPGPAPQSYAILTLNNGTIHCTTKSSTF